MRHAGSHSPAYLGVARFLVRNSLGAALKRWQFWISLIAVALLIQFCPSGGVVE